MGSQLKTMQQKTLLFLFFSMVLFQQGSSNPKPKTYLVETKSSEESSSSSGYDNSVEWADYMGPEGSVASCAGQADGVTCTEKGELCKGPSEARTKDGEVVLGSVECKWGTCNNEKC